MKHTITDTTFGACQFTAEVTVADGKVNDYAAKFALYHVFNGAVEKAMGSRKVVANTANFAKLTNAYKTAGVVVTNVREYVPTPSEPARKMANALLTGAKAKGTLDALRALFGIPPGKTDDEMVEVIHTAMRGK